MLRRLMLAVVVVTFAGGAALAQETCHSKAVGKDGKPLAGAAKTSFMKKWYGRHLRNQSGEPGGQAAFGCCEDQFHEEVRKGRLNAVSDDTDHKGATAMTVATLYEND
jgi:hypothetical protein